MRINQTPSGCLCCSYFSHVHFLGYFREAPDGAHVARSLEEAIELLTTGRASDNIERLFVIGGADIYKVCFDEWSVKTGNI